MKTPPQSGPLATVALQTWVSFLVITGGVIVLLFMYAIRSVLLQLVIALILAIALAPMVRFLIKHHCNRVVASVVAVLSTLLVLSAIVGAIASPLITQGGDLVKSAPQLVTKATSNHYVKQLDQKYGIVNKTKDFSKNAPKMLGGSSGPVLGAVGSAFGAVSSFFVILILVLFMLIEGPTAWGQFVRLLGKREAAFVTSVADKIITAVGGFINGNLLISLIAGVFTLVLLLVFRVPYAFALAALVAVFDIIPLVGATLATVVVGLVALTKGLIVALVIVGLMLLYQFVEGNILQPIIYGKSVEMSQLLIMVATIIGALLGGIIGVLLAIPVAAAIQIVLVELLRANGANLEPEVARSVKGAHS